MEVTQRYSNLDTVQKTLHILQSAGLITPDGRPISRSDRSPDGLHPPAPFKLDQRLEPEIAAEIVARYEAGEPSTAIGTAYGLNKNSVIKILREVGISIRRQPLTGDQVTEAVQLYEAGQSLAKIGRRFGVDHGTVWRALRKRGVPMRDTHGRER